MARADENDRHAPATTFATEGEAYWYLEALRWPHGPVCPNCGSVNNAYHFMRKTVQGSPSHLHRWRCRACGMTFSVLRGTFLQGSTLPVSKWIGLVRLLCTSTGQLTVSSLCASLDLSVKGAGLALRRFLRAVRQSPAAGTDNTWKTVRILQQTVQCPASQESCLRLLLATPHDLTPPLEPRSIVSPPQYWGRLAEAPLQPGDPLIVVRGARRTGRMVVWRATVAHIVKQPLQEATNRAQKMVERAINAQELEEEALAYLQRAPGVGSLEEGYYTCPPELAARALARGRYMSLSRAATSLGLKRGILYFYAQRGYISTRVSEGRRYIELETARRELETYRDTRKVELPFGRKQPREIL